MVQQAAVMTAAQHRFMIIGTAQAVAGGACCALAQLTATSNHAPIIRADSLLSKLPVKATEKDDTFARNDTTAIPLPASLPHHWSTRLTHEGAPDQRRARGWLGSWAASPLLTHGAAAAAPAAAAAGSWQPRHPLARSLHSTARPHASQQEGQQQQQPNLDQQHQQQQADPSAAHGGGSVPEGAGSAAASAARASSVPPGRPPNDVVYFGPLSQQHKLLKVRKEGTGRTVVGVGGWAKAQQQGRQRYSSGVGMPSGGSGGGMGRRGVLHVPWPMPVAAAAAAAVVKAEEHKQEDVADRAEAVRAVGHFGHSIPQQ